MDTHRGITNRIREKQPLLKPLWHVLAIAVVAIGLGLTATACETPTESGETQSRTTGPSQDLSSAVTTIAQTAQLSEEQTERLREAARSYEGEPGESWYLAADLHEALSQEQIDRLMARLQERRERFRERLEARRDASENGQRWKGRRGRHGPEGLRRLEAALDLSDEQTKQIAAIRREYRARIKELFESLDGDAPDEATREELRNLHKQMREAIGGVLTDEQREQLAKRMAEWKERRKERKEERQEHREAVRTAMIEALGLTEEQQEQLRKLWSEARSENGRPGPPRLHRNNVREAMNGILTPEQREIFALHHVISMRARFAQKGAHRFHHRGS